jgi:predicted PurR-regulated permease PerM
MNKRQIDISTSVILRTIAILLGFWFLYLVRDVLALFFLSIILAATFDPLIDWMGSKKIPRSFAISLIYALLFSSIGILGTIIIPPLVGQFKEFTANIPAYSEKLTATFSGLEQYAQSYGFSFSSHEFLQNTLGSLSQSSGSIFSTTVSVVTFFISVLVVLALTFYMSVREDVMNKFFVSIAPKAQHDYIVSLTNRIKNKIGKWLGGQMLLMLIIFVLDFAVLSAFGVPYALILAMLAGLLEIVPYLGPIISTALASAIGFLISPMVGLIVLCVLTVIQQLESHVIVPQVMKKVVGLNPIVVILALLIGAKLGGSFGAILSIPIATSLSVFVGDLIEKKNKDEEENS